MNKELLTKLKYQKKSMHELEKGSGGEEGMSKTCSGIRLGKPKAIYI